MVRFDQAWQAANDWTSQHLAAFGARVVVVRDLFGRIRLIVDDRNHSPELPGAEHWVELSRHLGAFASEDLLLRASETPFADILLTNPDLRTFDSHRILERQVVDADWTRLALDKPLAQRVTFFGVKGGVGRSTATLALCQHLAKRGRKVLVVDLDLESPGIGSTLLDSESFPAYGVVDWFVEQAVGQADQQLLSQMALPSPLGANSEGEIVVVPAGSNLGQYVSKLSRVYLDLPGETESEDFGRRLNRLILELEAYHKPDLTLLDCRSGIHDISAVALTRLGALNLLFAVDTRQTWDAYRKLFEPWIEAKHLRGKLKMVAAMMPETNTKEYFEKFNESSYRLFQDTLYEESAAEDVNAFNFDLTHEDAPHYPLRIHWSRSLQQYDPIREPEAVTDKQWQAGFEEFVEAAEMLLFPAASD